jgi:hypothetical protein
LKTLNPSFRRHRTCLRLEELEARHLLSGYDPMAVEQLFLEELNDARANPAAYGASIGVDLSAVAPSQPLAFSTQLIEAARLHSQDMNNRGYFSHYTPENIDPGQRMTAAGFAWTDWGESIAGGTAFPGPSDALRGLIIDAGVPDLGHRRHLLAIDSMFQNQNQVGIGIVQAGTGPLVDYYTIDTAAAVNWSPFLTGVVFRDDNQTGKYAIGEGLGGVTIAIAGVGSTTTFASGGYNFPLSPGIYTVTASGGGLASPITEQVVVGGQNARLNFLAGDDHYVQKLYQTVLGRTASTIEIDGWLAYLNNGGSLSALPSIFEHSPEAEGRLIRNWYATSLGRQPAPTEIQSWVGAMQQGMTEEQVQGWILESDEFYQRAGSLDSSLSGDSSYIQALYSLVLGRMPSSGELNGWAAALATMPRSAVVSGFVSSQEFRSDVITGYYFSILHRTSAPSAAEVSGWALSGFGFTDIRIMFESSAEFMQS